MKRKVKRYPNLEVLSDAAAEFICSFANGRVHESGLFTIVLSGGKTPKLLYEKLAAPPYAAKMPWPHIHLFWGDERCVPPDHPESNFPMAFRALISRVPIPSQNVHRIPAEVEPPEGAAKAYEKTLREFFRYSNTHSNFSHEGGPFPSFDLIVLGVGGDGHTASLFPGDKALGENKRWVTAVRTPYGSPPVARITLTLPLISRGLCILFLVSGAGKREVVGSILDDPKSAAQRYPAARVSTEGRVVWLIDEESL